MKKIYFLFFLFFALQNLHGAEVYLYAASSLNKPVSEIAEKFNKEFSNIKAVLITGGSGQLLNKIIFSKKADVYIPASEFFLKKAIESDIVVDHKSLIYQTPVFGLSAKSNKNIRDFNDLVEKNIKIAFGRQNTMALGKIYAVIEKKLPKNIADKLRNKKSVEAINVSQIVNYLKSGVVDAGILFDSTAKINGLKYVKIPDEYNRKIKVSAALLNSGKRLTNSKKLFNFILENKKIFKKYGFEIAKYGLNKK